jgi:hypothetical protein
VRGLSARYGLAAVPVRVHRVLHLALALALVRLGLGAVGFLAAHAAGANADAAAVALAVGAGGSIVGLVSSQRWALAEQGVDELPTGAERSGGLVRALGAALLPSTAVVTALLAISLAFEPILAAVLAGVLAGMGALTVTSALDVAVWERRGARLLFADAARRRYDAPR